MADRATAPHYLTVGFEGSEHAMRRVLDHLRKLAEEEGVFLIENPLDEMPIEAVIGTGSRGTRWLKEAGIYYVYQLLGLTEEEILSICQEDRTEARAVFRMLKNHGLSLKDSVPRCPTA